MTRRSSKTLTKEAFPPVQLQNVRSCTHNIFKKDLFESTQSSLRKPNLTGNFLTSIFHFLTFCNPPHLLAPHPGVLQSWQQTVARISEKGCARLYLCSLVLVLACTCARLYLCSLVLVFACACLLAILKLLTLSFCF